MQFDVTTRNGVRELLAHCQMSQPTNDQLVMLHGHIARQLIEYAGMRDTLRVGKIKKKARSIACDAYYFDDRQGVTFERDGFVGIAGWADDSNVQPFLRALVAWAKEVSGFDNDATRGAGPQERAECDCPTPGECEEYGCPYRSVEGSA